MNKRDFIRTIKKYVYLDVQEKIYNPPGMEEQHHIIATINYPSISFATILNWFGSKHDNHKLSQLIHESKTVYDHYTKEMNKKKFIQEIKTNVIFSIHEKKQPNTNFAQVSALIKFPKLKHFGVMHYWTGSKNDKNMISKIFKSLPYDMPK